jgi:hypothetical protein
MSTVNKFILWLSFFVITLFSASLASAYPALYFRYRALGADRRSCLSAAEQTIRSASLSNFGSDKFASGGTTDSARAFISCTPRPRVGDCGGEGSTVMFVVASDKSADDANELLARLDKSFREPRIIDCGPVGVPSSP